MFVLSSQLLPVVPGSNSASRSQNTTNHIVHEVEVKGHAKYLKDYI